MFSAAEANATDTSMQFALASASVSWGRRMRWAWPTCSPITNRLLT